MGRRMSINALGKLITGRIQVIADTISVAGTLLDNWYVVGTDIAARDLTVAGRTRSTADDKRVLADIFKENDSFQLSHGDDYIDGHAGNDLLRGGVGHDSLIGGAGNDGLLGQGGDDRLYLDFGNDTLDGGAGRDWVVASGAGRITVDRAKKGAQNTGYGQDVLVRVENVQAGSGNDRISGSDSTNELLGSGGDERLIGRGGNDTLRGGGDDVLDGGRGCDVMQGGLGADLFLLTIFRPAAGPPTGSPILPRARTVSTCPASTPETIRRAIMRSSLTVKWRHLPWPRGASSFASSTLPMTAAILPPFCPAPMRIPLPKD